MHEALTLDVADTVADAFCFRMHEALTLDVVDTVEDARRFLTHEDITVREQFINADEVSVIV